MLRWLIDRSFAVTSCCSFLILFGLFCYFQFGFFRPRVSAYRGKTFEGTVFYKPSQAKDIIAALTAENRRSYLIGEVTEDLVFPVIYALMFAVAIAGLAPVARVPRWLVLLPYATAFFDYIENACVAAMLLLYAKNASGGLGPLPYIGSVATPIKSVLFLLSAVTSMIVGLLWVIRK